MMLYKVVVTLQTWIHTGFHRFTKIGQIFHNKYFLIKKNTFQAKIWPISRLNDSETQERALKGVKIQENSWESLSPEHARLRPRSAPALQSLDEIQCGFASQMNTKPPQQFFFFSHCYYLFGTAL